MNLVRWKNTTPARSPLTTLFDDFFNTSIADIVGTDFTTNQPSVNIIEEGDRYIIEVAAPGINKSDFNIEVDKDQLIISATHAKETAVSETSKFTRREYNFSSFNRSFYIPQLINKDAIDASYDKGILSITLLKTEEAKEKAPTVIDIK